MGKRLGLGATVILLAGVMTAPGTGWTADNVPTRIDAAKAAYQKNDLARTAHELELALTEIHDRLGQMLTETLPSPLPGWQADPAEVQGLAQVGGGLSVNRAYSKGETSLNISLVLDSPAVDAAVTQLAPNQPLPPHSKRVKVGTEDALMRYDASTQSGEITMILGTRVLLEIEGDNLTNGDVLPEAAKGWNIARIRSLIGI